MRVGMTTRLGADSPSFRRAHCVAQVRSSIKKTVRGLPRCAVVENPPSKAGTQIPSLAGELRSHGQVNLRNSRGPQAATTEPVCSGAHALQQRESGCNTTDTVQPKLKPNRKT